MSNEGRVAAATGLAMGVIVARDDREAGREYGDLLQAMPDLIGDLFADGQGPAVLSLLATFDIAVTKLAMHTGRSRQVEARIVLEALAERHGTEVPT